MESRDGEFQRFDAVFRFMFEPQNKITLGRAKITDMAAATEAVEEVGAGLSRRNVMELFSLKGQTIIITGMAVTKSTVIRLTRCSTGNQL